MTRRVILVTGPPCAGKTTYARAHATPGDRILDQDAMGAKAMNAALARLRHTDGTTWIIRCAPGPTARAHLAQQVGATEHVHLEGTRDELIARATQRPHPRTHIAAISAWYTRERQDQAPREANPKRSSTQRGYGAAHRTARTAALNDLRQHDGQPCPHCGRPMWHVDREHLDLDHTDDRTGYRGLAHATCNRRAGQAKAMRMRATQQVKRSRNW